jgi:hypothetical protein
VAKSLPWGKLVPLLFILIGCVLPLLLAEQRPSPPVLQLPTHQRQPQFQDWSTRHALYSRYGTMAALEAASRDPRAIFRWHELDQQSQSARFVAGQSRLRSLLLFRAPTAPGRFPVLNSADMHKDWAISLSRWEKRGRGGTEDETVKTP